MSTEFTPLRIAVLTSESAPGIDRMLADPNRGTVYELVAVLSNEREIADRDILEQASIPVIFEGDAVETRDILLRYSTDYVIADNYEGVIPEPLLAAFENRVIVLHDGDLTLRDRCGKRTLAGQHAVREAIVAGEKETRASAFVFTPDPSERPLLLLTGPYPVSPIVDDARTWASADLLIAYSGLHRTWMRRDAYGKMLTAIPELLAAGHVQVVRDTVWIDGVPGPCRLGEAPPACHERDRVSSGIPASCPFITR